MLHLALTLQLLAPPADVPRRLSLQPTERLQERTERGSLWAERLSSGGGVLAGQAAAVGVAAVAEGAFGNGHLDLMQPSFLAGLSLIAAELALVPLGAALGVDAADPDPNASFLERLGEAVHVRGVQGTLLAGFELVAAFASSPTLALAGVLALFGSDLVLFPLVLSHPSEALAAPPSTRPIDAPPRADAANLPTSLAIHF